MTTLTLKIKGSGLFGADHSSLAQPTGIVLLLINPVQTLGYLDGSKIGSERKLKIWGGFAIFSLSIYINQAGKRSTILIFFWQRTSPQGQPCPGKLYIVLTVAKCVVHKYH